MEFVSAAPRWELLFFFFFKEHPLNKPEERGELGREMKWHGFSKASALGHLGSSFRSSLSKATRETSFIHAISSAGVMYTITKNCSMGDFENCGCDESKNGKTGNLCSLTGVGRGEGYRLKSSRGKAGGQSFLKALDSSSYFIGGCS